MKTHINTCLYGFIVLVAVLVPSEALAQSYANQVWEQLQAHYSVVAGVGDYQLQNYVMGKLSDSGTDSWTFPLNSSDAYIVTAACDNDCSDIDVKIKDSSGTVVREDTESDDTPFIEFSPRSSGRYTIEVTMYACSANPCYFGFGLFSK